MEFFWGVGIAKRPEVAPQFPLVGIHDGCGLPFSDAMNSLSSALGIRILALLYFWYEFLRVICVYTHAGADFPIQFATESMFCDELSGTSYGSWRFSNPATSPAVCLLAGYFALAAEPGDLFPLISEEKR